ncbi:zinc metallopeptidase [Lactiplantibacillus mudanjiangensis]|mgnify:CR=1 FL=1|uniref:Zinc-dependent proteinase (Putative) [Lactobacillus plantarum JDM1] n=1 Tax=Lactiplantibacillus mudanjiangensis TaxID=1296538 RepID=A0A660DV61_9LACO|nr:zinc-dependent proteinase (putative) [Lactobacillus plantarum JDM1] [Lactiplantibacillus mudanjiangensis]VDG23957.1 zinc-dependent proteinase (putative) [Lactobacillus plantarum JDM1] [Lactiplantibacillus mudanjiangensis]VDG27138.1 zinc-dependent proteinase (putative) [Lactobacillus plantarum JDM1] [Lactiplantibacillus mudanjiangensis]VDG33959.1 zinc-dependent proteinase (putative) [Lactobacillus plantarum JDM1] [Lactiplantibacillus mudanjiangensis]
MFFFDPTYILVILGLVISMAASSYVNRTFRKYDAYRSQSNTTGTAAARFILDQSGIHNVGVQAISGDLTDNYNGQTKVLSLSESTANSTSVAAIGVAAHECGHAVQDHVNYAPMRLRTALVPVANIGSSLSLPLIIVGVLLSYNTTLIHLGIALFSLALVFQLVTLPVEFNASRRALQILSDGHVLTPDEVPMVRKVLTAAALTYVAAALSTFLQLLRLILIFGGQRDQD